MFIYRGEFALRDVLDGTSNTIGVFEDMHYNGYNGTVLDFTAYWDSAWISPLGAVGNLRNPMNNKNPGLEPINDCRCHGWSSHHPGGANAVLVDGSVRFFSETIDHFIQYCLATRAGGETFSF